jgi:hypothetical protein
LDDLVLLRLEPQLATGVQFQQGLGGLLAFGAVFDLYFSFGIQNGVQDTGSARLFRIDPDHRLLHAHVDHALFNQDLAFQHEHSVWAICPGSNLIGVERNGLGIARDVLRYAQDIGCRGKDNRGRYHPQGQD